LATAPDHDESVLILIIIYFSHLILWPLDGDERSGLHARWIVLTALVNRSNRFEPEA
jgi:hypothetical protein